MATQTPSLSTLSPAPWQGAEQPEPFWRRITNFGWLTILIGAMAMAATYPGRTHGLGMVTEPLLADLNLSDPDGRVFYATLNFWGTLIGAAFCLPIGWLFDRMDRRLILAGNLILLGLAVLWMSRVQSWQELFVTLILTRGLGQSALSVVSITIVAKSFDAARLGLAMACYASLSAPFHLLLIEQVKWAFEVVHYDWRQIWGGIGLSLIALSLTAAVLSKSTNNTSRDQIQSDEGSTLGEALRTPAFWVFGLTISLWGMIYSGISLFNEDIFRERGFDRSLYLDVLKVAAVIALISKFVFGWLTKSVPLSRLLAVCLLATAFSLCGLPFATQTWHAYAYGVSLGIASGAVALLFFATWGRLYGQRELGRIQGMAQMLTVFASASGPFVIASGKRLTDSYTSVFFMMAGLVGLMAIAAWFTPLPRPSSRIQENTI